MSAQDLEQHAREFLAAEYEKDGKTDSAEHIRTKPLLPNKARAVRAIAAAIRQQPAPVDLEQFREAVAWQVQLADALECFWNAAIDGSGRDRDNIIGGMVQGFAAVAYRLREHATAHQPAPVVDDARMARALEWVRDAAEGDAGYREYLPVVEEVFAAYSPSCGGRTVRVVDDAMVERALNAKAGNWPVWQLFSCEDEAREIMCIALTAALARAQGVQS